MFGVDFRNPWVRAVDAGRPFPAWLSALGALFASAAFVLGGQAVARGLSSGWASPGGGGLSGAIATNALFYACVFGPFHLAALLMSRAVERRPRPEGLGAAPAGALGLGVGALGLGTALGITALAGATTPGGGAPTGAEAATGVTASLVLFAFQAGAEELFFRGWLQPRLCARWGGWIGLAATAALFAAAHLIGAPVGGLALANLFLGGLLFGLLALRTGGLSAPFAAHLAWNWCESAVFGLEPNPGISPLGALMDLDLVGPRLWSGSGDGLNGGLADTLVLGVLTAVFALLPPKRVQAA